MRQFVTHSFVLMVVATLSSLHILCFIQDPRTLRTPVNVILAFPAQGFRFWATFVPIKAVNTLRPNERSEQP